MIPPAIGLANITKHAHLQTLGRQDKQRLGEGLAGTKYYNLNLGLNSFLRVIIQHI